jgi:NAD(P)-dependent dehydrogenase (short-subunit alcohol dehydrogenase family)
MGGLTSEIKGYSVDITDQGRVFRCFRDIETSFGSIFTLVNVAGLVDQQPFEEITPDGLDRLCSVNIKGTIYCSQAALKSMKFWGDGRIINFSSKSGKTGSALMAAYSATKGAIIALTQAMAFEFARYNIKVNSVCPGIVEDSNMWTSVKEGYEMHLKASEEEVVRSFTAKIPLGRLCKTSDILTLVRFLTLDGDYCTGQAFNVTGGREVH